MVAFASVGEIAVEADSVSALAVCTEIVAFVERSEGRLAARHPISMNQKHLHQQR